VANKIIIFLVPALTTPRQAGLSDGKSPGPDIRSNADCKRVDQ